MGKQLSKQLIRAILSVYMTIAMLITGAQIAADFHQEKNNLRIQIETLASTFKPTLTEALWNYDNEQLTASLEGIYRNQEVFGIKIQSADQTYQIGNTIDEMGLTSYQPAINDDLSKSLAGKRYANLYTNHLPLYSPESNAEEIGQLIIYSSSVTVLERTYTTLLITLISAFIKTAGLWIIAIIMINRWVARPINQLTEHMTDLNLNSPQPPQYPAPKEAQLHDQNELAFLETSFYSLCRELAEKNRLVNDYTNNLEQRIASRTESLNRTLSDLESANNAKRDFISNMGHELRTPLNSIIGMSCVLLKKSHSSKDKQILSIIKDSGDTLLFIINDILDYSRLEAGQLVLNSEEFDFAAQLDRTLSIFTEQASSKRIPFNCNIAPGVPELITSDDIRINQILVNLIGNAYKFTHTGEIELNIECIQVVEKHKAKLRFSVIDTGIGIKEHQISELFKAFTQAENATAKNYGGTGLGLSISGTLVTLLGGEIGASANPTGGSTFWFTLVAPYAEDQATPQIPGARNKQIILVTQKSTIKQHFSALCLRYNMHLTTFDDSASLAVEIRNQSLGSKTCFAFASECNHSDIFNSPEWPTLEQHFSKTPKLLLGFFEDLPEISHLDNEAEYSLIPYPLSVRNILKSIQASYKRKSEHGRKHQFSDNGNISALVVDDNTSNQKVICQMLEDIGIPSISANDGAHAIEQIQQRNATFPLIIMDYQMPQMDGIETTKRIRRWETKQETTDRSVIIALSAYNDNDHHKAANKAGMNGYLVKPVTLEKLEHYISQQLAQVKSTD